MFIRSQGAIDIYSLLVVMVSKNDHVESFLNSLQVIKDVLSPIEFGIRKAAKDLEHCWPGSKNRANNIIEGFGTQLNGGGTENGNRVLVCSVKKRSGQCLVSDDERKKGLSIKVPFKTLLGFLLINCGSNGCKDMLKKGLKEEVGDDDGTCRNCLKFAVTWSLLLNGFVPAFPSPFKAGKNPFSKVSKKVNARVVIRPPLLGPPNPLNYLRAVASILEGKKADVNVFLGNLRFARVGGIPSSVVGVTSVKEEGDENMEESGNKEEADNKEETGVSAPKKLANGLLRRSSKDYPDKKKLFSVQDFFKYTEAEGRRFFEELDRDGDGQVTLEDLEVATRKRKLPRRYAPYTTLCLSKSGTLKKSEILASLKNAGLPANEDNAMAMMRFLNADTEESISYGHFRNFMLLLPSDRLQEDPRSIWFEAATVVAVAPPVELPASSVLKSALVGGLSCALSCSLLHPVDTIKGIGYKLNMRYYIEKSGLADANNLHGTRVQASTLSFPEIISKLPQIGVRGLYRGSIPAILGQFSSHGLRTGIFEASRLLLVNVAPNLPDIQVQSIASFCSTFLGTAVRIPCEVLKQRLQAGLFDNVGEAIVGTWTQDGLKGFFRGTGATLFREVPFYVAGMGLYAESKKLAQHLLERELEPWETIAVGALSGGLAAVVTTPFDVMKTRMMTAPGGRPLSMSMVAISIVRHEGLLGLFKGAVPRFFWIAPLGAMNFAGYELARKAMERNEEQKAMSSG
ncbi:hypothetical protein LOK49_LG01G00567 [Camellia lanceoleosa]|uniref:Uncharacterized protein n=1 Tax=Camellia lanceoleosa TaxID=1840588 RepID=A0ACC0J6J1_9ERIC|nr:hypothetical protein LOK49_LG01G00567 [Camellia lanceoleosa]